MYELMEIGDTLFLTKKRGDDLHYTTVATFTGKPHEIRDLALEIVNVLNTVGAAVLVAEQDEGDKEDEAWKPASDPSYDDTGA